MALDIFANLAAEHVDYIVAALFFILTFTVSYILFSTFAFFVRRQDLEKRFHGHILRKVKFPYYFFCFFIAFNLAQSRIAILQPYEQTIENIFVLIFVILGAYLSVKIVGAILSWMAPGGRSKLNIEQTSLMSLRTLINIFIGAFAIAIILAQFGIDITPLLASLGVGGIAIALALQPTLSNYFSSMYITTDKTLRIGDFIEVNHNGEKLHGYVDKLNWRTIRIKTISNNIISIPNSKLADSIVTNYSQPQRALTIRVSVGVAYDSDLDKVEKVAEKVANTIMKEEEAVVDDYGPFIRFKEFGDSNIYLTIFIRVDEWINRYRIQHRLIKDLFRAFKKNKIRISFPCSNVYIKENTKAK